MKLVVVGSIGIDTIETPREKRVEILGGSASYACATASRFTKTGMVGVVGTDFPGEYRKLYEDFGIDLEGLQIAEGKTFRWSGVYEENMDNRRTLSTDLNVFENFSPELPKSYRKVSHLFLGNIAPDLQLRVLEQVEKPGFILVDTMDLWINISRKTLLEVIARTNMLTLNESEARLLTGEHTLRGAASELLTFGPEYILIKRGENGSMLFTSSGALHIMPAYPVENVLDPTGAGDTFAGGLMGYLAAQDEINIRTISEAMLYGNIIASFGIEKFSLERLQNLTEQELNERVSAFREMISFD